MTTNIQLEEICKKLGVRLNAIRSKDDLPRLHERRTGLYIINSEDMFGSEGGIHWVGLYVNQDDYHKESVYFDSFGGHPYRQCKEFATSKLFYNKEQIQDIESKRCGEFVCYFGYCMDKKYKHVKGLQNRLLLCIRQFNLKDSKANDEILRKKYLSLNIKI